MFRFRNFENFTYSSESNFPKEECVIQNERESDVFDSDKVYQVLYINIKFPSDKMLAFAKPYVCKEENGGVSFGWVAVDTKEVFGNVENSCQFWDEFVVGFIPVDNDAMQTDRELFEKYKQIIEEQYN